MTNVQLLSQYCRENKLVFYIHQCATDSCTTIVVSSIDGRRIRHELSVSTESIDDAMSIIYGKLKQSAEPPRITKPPAISLSGLPKPF